MKLRKTCDEYSKINLPYEYRKFIKGLSERNDSTILKTDK